MSSICQVTAITEFATIFVDLRVILAYHKLQSSTLYAINGLVMTVQFFLFRVVYYLWMVFGVITDFFIYRGNETWRLYDETTQKWIVVSISMYCLMIILNLYWFNRMLKGFIKGV